MWRLFVFLIVFSFVRSSAGSQLLVPVDWSRGSHRYSRGGTLLQLHPWPLLPTGTWSVVPVQWCWSEAFWSCSDRFGVFWGRNDGQFNNRLSSRLRKHPTFCHATTCFQAKWRLRNGRRNSMLMACHYLDLGRASDWLKQIFLAARPIRSTTQTWIVIRHQCEISEVVLQTAFREETSGAVATCRLLSQATCHECVSSRIFLFRI